jgi:hypothetical protein
MLFLTLLCLILIAATLEFYSQRILTCPEIKEKLGNWDIDCNDNTADGYYWVVGDKVREYGYYGLGNSGVHPPCNANHLGEKAQTASWQASSDWMGVRTEYCWGYSLDGKTNLNKNCDYKEGPIFNCNLPHCGIYEVTCVCYYDTPPEYMDNTPPEIIITQPNVTRGYEIVKRDKQVLIKGKAIDKNGIFEVQINGEDANIDAQGNFSKIVFLAVGENTFTVKATDIKQNSSNVTFKIVRQSDNNVVVNNQENNTDLKTGKYYALIIGNNIYQDPAISSLDEPINDATKLYNVLTSEYTFDPNNVTLLKDATYVQMIDALDNLSSKITENDNLLVFYAGHGWWDEDKKLGYWLPTDAKQKSTAFWIANSRISDYMSTIDSKHTLLIADACFSGSIFKTRKAFDDAGQAINSLYELPSRSAMTSGNLKEVPDKSVFLEYLVKRLDNNTEKYVSADQLFVSFRIAVMNNSSTEPQFGTIQNAGDEGGEFIFIRR